MKLYAKITKDVAALVPYIQSGRVIVFPTGTSYGLAVDALQGNALQRLRNIKGRDENKTFTVFMRGGGENKNKLGVVLASPSENDHFADMQKLLSLSFPE